MLSDARALEGLSPYLVATPALQARLTERPLGLGVPRGHCFDPTRRASAPFLSRLEQLDQVVSGPLAMAMPRWAFYDCAELPGLVCGFASSAGSVPERLREVWPLEARNGPVPLSMCMAVPMLQRDRWLAYVLCDLHEALPGATPPPLRIPSLALACDLTGARRMQGVTQWSSSKLAALASFAPLSLRAAWVPAHSVPATCVVEFDAGAAAIADALAAPQRELAARPRWLDVGDPSALEMLQRELEAGAEPSILGAPRRRGGSRVVPLSPEAWEPA